MRSSGLERLRSRHTRSIEAISSLLRENADLRQQLQEVRHAADRVSDENQALLSRIAGLERRVAQQSQQEDKGAQERFKSALADLEGTLVRTRAQLQDKEELLRQRAAEVAASADELAGLRSALSAAQAETASADARADALRAELEALHEELAALQTIRASRVSASSQTEPAPQPRSVDQAALEQLRETVRDLSSRLQQSSAQRLRALNEIERLRAAMETQAVVAGGERGGGGGEEATTGAVAADLARENAALRAQVAEMRETQRQFLRQPGRASVGPMARAHSTAALDGSRPPKPRLQPGGGAGSFVGAQLPLQSGMGRPGSQTRLGRQRGAVTSLR